MKLLIFLGLFFSAQALFAQQSTCAPGDVWMPDFGVCATCPEGTIPSPEGGFCTSEVVTPPPGDVCPDGNLPVGGLCIGDEPGTDCPDGQMWDEAMQMCMPMTSEGLCPDGSARTGMNHATPGKCINIPFCPQGQFWVQGNAGAQGRCTSQCPGSVINSGRVCDFDTPTVKHDLQCGVARNLELTLRCQAVGCTRQITARQEQVAAEAMSNMERGHNDWHRIQNQRENPGQSFFLMHSRMIEVVQEAVMGAGLGCMPTLKQLPMPEYRFTTDANGQPIAEETNNGLAIVRSYVESQYGDGPIDGNGRNNQQQYDIAYQQWAPYSPSREQELLDIGIASDLSMTATERLRSESLEQFGRNVQRMFHNTLHGALNDSRNILNSSFTATRSAFFWLIHGLVDQQPDIWLEAREGFQTDYDWSTDWFTMSEAMPMVSVPASSSTEIVTIPESTRIIIVCDSNGENCVEQQETVPASTVERTVPAVVMEMPPVEEFIIETTDELPQ